MLPFPNDQDEMPNLDYTAFRTAGLFAAQLVMGQFDVEAAEPVPILSGRRHLAIPPGGFVPTTAAGKQPSESALYTQKGQEGTVQQTTHSEYPW